MTLDADSVFEIKLKRISKGVRASESEFSFESYSELLNSIELLSQTIVRIFEEDVKNNPDSMNDIDYEFAKLSSEIFHKQMEKFATKNGVSLQERHTRS